MLKGLVAIWAEKIVMLYHGEQNTFEDGPKTRLSIDRDFDPWADVNVNEFDSRQVIFRSASLSQSSNVSW